MKSIHQTRVFCLALVIISLASYRTASLEASPVVPRRSLPIHGPFDVNSAELQATGTATGTSATPIPAGEEPIPAGEEKGTHLLHFTVTGSHAKTAGGKPVDVTTSKNLDYTPDPGWVIDKSSGNGGYSASVSKHLGVVQGPKVTIQGNTLKVSGETQSWGTLDVSITVYLKKTGNSDLVKNQTPKATTGFIDIAGLGGIDPGIAVGTNYILLCDDHTGVAVYDKAGKLLGPKSSESAFANPFTMRSLFNKVKADIDPQLNYPAGLPPGYSVAAGCGMKTYGDIRIMFDSYRKRFWIYAAAENTRYFSKPGSTETIDLWDANTIVDYPAVKLARRDKAAVAVSKTEDPRDGFYTYWWNATIHNGESNELEGGDDPDFKISGAGADYPSIGISPKYFVATTGVNRRDPKFITKTTDQAKAWWDGCVNSFEQDGHIIPWCGPFYIHLMVVDAGALAAGNLFLREGQTGPPPSQGRSFGLFVDAKNYLTDLMEDGEFAHAMARGVRPVVIHGPIVGAGPNTEGPTTVQSADAYFVNSFIKRDGKEPEYYLVLWSLVGDNLVPTRYRISSFTFTDWTQVVLNASYRDGNLYATFQYCAPTFKHDCSPCIRVIHANTLNSQATDLTFGTNNVDDNNPSARFAYEFPGIEVNKHGDIVVVYTRYSTPTFPLKQEVRFSVWYHNESGQRPSRLLKAGEALQEPNKSGTDTAGIAVDPADDEAIWIAHIFAAKNVATGYAYRRIAFGKVFGTP